MEPVESVKTRRHISGGFDVTAIIGRVTFDELGELDPVTAAMHLIGEHRAEGEYHFPHEDGGDWIVTVEHRVQ